MNIFGWSRYVDALELQLAQQRGDFQERIREKDTEIRRLRAELASRGVRMEAPPEPRPRVTGIRDGKFVTEAVSIPVAPLDWQGELNRMLEEEEAKEKADGV